MAIIRLRSQVSSKLSAPARSRRGFFSSLTQRPNSIILVYGARTLSNPGPLPTDRWQRSMKEQKPKNARLYTYNADLSLGNRFTGDDFEKRSNDLFVRFMNHEASYLLMVT